MLHVIVALLALLSISFQVDGLDTTTTARLRMRDAPSPQAAVITTLEIGAAVRLDGRAALPTLWVRGISAAGQVGWMSGNYLATPADALRALPIVDESAPFTLSAPSPTAPVQAEGPGDGPALISPGPGRNYGVISGITTNARAIFERGRELGNRPNVFSKVGDSITAMPPFLYAIGWGAYDLGTQGQLQPVIDYFSAVTAREGNSFANPSLAANNGWTTVTVLDPNSAWRAVCEEGETPLACEYRLVKPAVALIMLGTNDLARLSAEQFRANLNAIVTYSVDQGVVPVLSTIPNRVGYEASVPTFNTIILETARSFRVPLWDYGAALRGLPSDGLGDGIHPSVPPGAGSDDVSGAFVFSATTLQYGATERNLTALQVLDTQWRRVLYA